jgi:malonate decarboxylase epsilon subunit
MTVAFLFPGQGSQHPGMLHTLPDHPAVTHVLEEASDELHTDLRALDSEQALSSTVSTQLALLAAGVAVARALVAEGVQPQAVAGLSVGAFAAAVTCGTLEFPEGIRLVKQRASMMEEMFPRDDYGLSAVVGLDEQQVAALVAAAHSDETPVFVANINAPRQIVIAGSRAGMMRVLAAALHQGARKAEALAVSVPSHCRLLQPVAEALLVSMRGMKFGMPHAIFVGNVRARALRTAAEIAEDLANNVARGVRWHETTTLLAELGCELFLEMHPGHVLTGLARDAHPEIRSIALESSSLRYVSRLAQRARDA